MTDASVTFEEIEGIAVIGSVAKGFVPHVIVLFPYKIGAGRLMPGNAFAQTGEADIFPAR